MHPVFRSLCFVVILLGVFMARADTVWTSPSSTHSLYAQLRLNNAGLPLPVYEMAIRGWQKLHVQGALGNSAIISIADFSQSSNNKRLYVIDLKKRRLLFHTYVAHGRNTGEEFAKHFSNAPSSLKSSLGFYLTAEAITSPKHGPALLINGVEKGFNTNALKREIIIHAAYYCTEEFIKQNGRLGRSYGCPVIPPGVIRQVIATIKNGTCLFIYQNNKDYLSKSELIK